MRVVLLLTIVLLIVSGCTTMTPTDPALQTAGPRPTNVNDIVMASLMRRGDFKRMKDIEISEIREGGQWTGLSNQGMVPSWYVCVNFKSRIFPLGHQKLGPFIVWIRNNEIVGVRHILNDDFSKHECKY